MATHFQQDTHRLAVSTQQGTYFFSPAEIVRLEASSSYSILYLTNGRKIVASKVLKEFAEILEPYGFLRIHRTHLINREHITAVHPGGMIRMKDESVATVSRRMKRGIRCMLKPAA